MAHLHSDTHLHHDHDHEDCGGGGHGHAHGPGGHSHAPASFGRAFAIGIALNAAYVGGEALAGLLSHSLALLADAGHNLGDVLGLAAAWLAQGLGRRRPTTRYTYGLRRSSILSALGNAVVLLVVTGAIAWEAVRRLLLAPAPVGAETVMAVAAIGIAINGGTALMFAAGRKGDLNIRAAFQHMAADALLAAGVVAAGAVIWFTGWLWLDPLVSLVLAAVIVAGTWSVLRHSLDLALDAVPPGIDRIAVEGFLRQLPGVVDLHDLHIWGMSTTETALTAHLVRPGPAANDAMLRQAAADLRARFGIGHATFQVEQDLDGRCILAIVGSV
ncbi:cation diffusion facilitator family transporter [Lichenicoccus sp.]|uniref:cation diffusion facilitator family transporter n=1 Tax=Lichenicoccus sp. TaxID=2781899 RepID=UPI003D0EB050